MRRLPSLSAWGFLRSPIVLLLTLGLLLVPAECTVAVAQSTPDTALETLASPLTATMFGAARPVQDTPIGAQPGYGEQALALIDNGSCSEERAPSTAELTGGSSSPSALPAGHAMTGALEPLLTVPSAATVLPAHLHRGPEPPPP